MEDPCFIFSSDKLELKSEGENFFVEGYISTSDLDLVNDIVTKACLLDMAEQMKTRTIKFDVEHESFRGKSQLETEINKTLIPVAKVDDFIIDKKGLKVRSVLNKHSNRFEEVKGSIEDGFLDAFSIAFVPVSASIQEKNGEKVRMLEKINLLNVAYTGNPINTSSTMTNVFMKSLDFLEEKAKPKKPKPQPDPHKEDEEEEEEEDEKGDKKKKKVGPGGHKPDRTGPHGAGAGPGEGQADGSGKEVKYNHLSDTKTKLQEVKKMTEDNKTEEEEESEEVETGKEEAEGKDDEKKEDAEEKEESEENAEVKSLGETVAKLQEEVADLKAQIKVPLKKSIPTTEDKSNDFEDKTISPLDLIA